MTDQKRMIDAEMYRLGAYDLDGKISDLRQILDDLIERYGPDAVFHSDYVRDGYSEDARFVLRLCVKRLESDEEQAQRIAADNKRLARTREYDRKMYERLKAQFEGE